MATAAIQKFSTSSLNRLRDFAAKAETRLRKVREQGEQMVEHATDTAVISGTAFALGVVQGRTGGIEVFGAPLDLLVGVGAHAGAFMKVGGKHSRQLHNIGNGALASYASIVGRGIGTNWKQTGRLGGNAKVAGIAGDVGMDYQSDQELAASVLRR